MLRTSVCRSGAVDIEKSLFENLHSYSLEETEYASSVWESVGQPTFFYLTARPIAPISAV